MLLFPCCVSHIQNIWTLTVTNTNVKKMKINFSWVWQSTRRLVMDSATNLFIYLWFFRGGPLIMVPSTILFSTQISPILYLPGTVMSIRHLLLNLICIWLIESFKGFGLCKGLILPDVILAYSLEKVYL